MSSIETLRLQGEYTATCRGRIDPVIMKRPSTTEAPIRPHQYRPWRLRSRDKQPRNQFGKSLIVLPEAFNIGMPYYDPNVTPNTDGEIVGLVQGCQ